MKQNILIIWFLIPSIFISCSGKKETANESKKENFLIESSRGTEIIGKTEKVVSQDGNIETVEGFDSNKPSQVLYLYQRMRISSDSTVLNGMFKIFYPNSQLKGVFHFRNGKQEGLALMYRPDGTLEKKQYRYWGTYMGPQYEYDSSGTLKKVYFMSDDSSYWFLVRYDNAGKIDGMKGQVYALMETISSRIKTGEEIKVFLQLPKIGGTHLSVHYTISNNRKKLLDTTQTSFVDAHNGLFSGITHQFKSRSKGVNKLKVVVKLMDSTSNKLLKADSFSKAIMVN